MDQPTSVKDELSAMSKIVRIMDGVDGATADRIAGWLYDRFHMLDSEDVEQLGPMFPLPKSNGEQR